MKRTKPKKQQDDTTDCYFVRILLSGKYPTQSNLFKWKKDSSPTCPCCKTDVENSLYNHGMILVSSLTTYQTYLKPENLYLPCTSS